MMQSSNETEAARLLREGRVAASIEIEAASLLTRIPQEQIRALEEGRYADLPGPAYARAFAGTLANAYGIDPETVIAALRRDLKEPSEPAKQPQAPQTRLQTSPGGVEEPSKNGSNGPFILLGALALAFLLLIGLTRIKDLEPTQIPAPGAADSTADTTIGTLDTAKTDTTPVPPPHDVFITVRDTTHSAFLLYIKSGRMRKATLENRLDTLSIDPDTSVLIRNLSTFPLRIGGAVVIDSMAYSYFRIGKEKDSTVLTKANEDEWKQLYDKIMLRRNKTRRDTN